MGIKLTIYSENEVNNICLTNHTIKKYGKNLEEPDGKNEYLSEPILGIEFSGKVEVYDKSGEILELKKLAEWAKRTAHEKDIYRKTVIEWNDISGNEYDSITLEKTFVVRYEQSFDGEKGEGEFYILLRSLDHMDDVFGQAWDNTAWSIDDVTVKVGDTAKIQFASNSTDVDKYQKSLEESTLEELYQKREDYKKLYYITSLEKRMLEDEIAKREQNKDSGDFIFKGADWLELAENNIPYIYSTKEIPYHPWTGAFDSSADLTFGIGHSIKTENEFKTIKNFINTHTDSEIAAEVQRYLESDLAKTVKDVNEFAKIHNIILEQHQFDAIVSLAFNQPVAITDKEGLVSALTEYNFDREKVIEGFTYTRFGGQRIDGLVTRRNNELNLFFNGDYSHYYDTKQKVIDAGIEFISYP